MPLPVAVVKMVGGWIVEIDRQLDEPQSKDPRIEINIRLWFSSDGCYVMDAKDLWVHE
jgi:hypothetical protein